jgi:hypothetical protein
MHSKHNTAVHVSEWGVNRDNGVGELSVRKRHTKCWFVASFWRIFLRFLNHNETSEGLIDEVKCDVRYGDTWLSGAVTICTGCWPWSNDVVDNDDDDNDKAVQLYGCLLTFWFKGTIGYWVVNCIVFVVNCVVLVNCVVFVVNFLFLLIVFLLLICCSC